MNEKQRRFCEEYLIDLNATRAYMAAYPSVKKESAARANASRMLTKANIREYIRERIQDQTERLQIAQDEVLGKIQGIAFDADELTKDRLRALELLGKHLGMFDQKDELDKEEQKARIAKLRRDAQSEEEKAEIAVSILGVDVEELGEIIG